MLAVDWNLPSVHGAQWAADEVPAARLPYLPGGQSKQTELFDFV
jgi:hypothetical protein